MLLHVVQQRIDRQITAKGILVRLPIRIVAANEHRLRLRPCVLRLRTPTKRRDFDDFPNAKHNVNETKPAPNDVRISK